MKRIYKYLLTTFASVAMLSVTSCRDDTFESFTDADSEYVKVSFNLAPEAASVSTRADYPSDQYSTGRIGDGGKADMLVYAVYDKNGNILPEYSEGVDPSLDIKGNTAGQTVKKITKFPYSVSIMLKRGEEYQIAFWAQSSKATRFYDTSDLRKVEVMYNELDEGQNEISGDNGNPDEVPATPNNDELRDAFCRSVKLVANNGNVEQNVYLYRPLAQINIGTTGYDYEIVTRNANVQYKYSKIRINRVARYLDVVEDKTIMSNSADEDHKFDYDSKDPEAFAVIDFGWAPIPAYNAKNMSHATGEEGKFPTYPSFTKYDWIYNGYDTETAHPKHNGVSLYEEYKDEEFLQVNLDGDRLDASGNKLSGGKTGNWITDSEIGNGYESPDDFHPYANLDNFKNRDTETFKYLSMCYILTSSTKEEARVINNVKMWIASDEKGANERELVNVNHVPVQRNWRTNIVGDLFTAENKFEIVLDRNFAGDYNMWKDNGEWQMSGPLADGVYYDAQNDVIEISSKAGLIWFQQMVNGTIKVRESADKSMVGNSYKYYTPEGVEKTLNDYPGITRPVDDPMLEERILVATHQKFNDNPAWPKDNNFHFTGIPSKTPEGMNVQATVKLMADIDLSGEEWYPIGFDGRIGEQLGWSVLENDEYTVSHKRADGRIFYGVFDGNGHSIHNLSTKRFSANVHRTAHQVSGFRTVYTTGTRHPSDNPQWFGYGLFGQIGGDAKVTDVRLNNVDIYGFNGVGGVVGVAYGGAIEISNCIVDGGNIEAVPMYRGDSYRTARTFARGVYMGGVVGYFNTDGGKVDNNEVRNLELKAVRRAGGLIGSINQKWMDANGSVSDEGKGLVDGTWKNQRESRPASISNNKLQNLTIIISSFNTFGEKTELNKDLNDNIVKAGFGFNNGNLEMYSQKFVGGYNQDANVRSDIKGIFRNNTENNVTLSLLTIAYNKKDEYYKKYIDKEFWDYSPAVRIGEIQNLPLHDMPMLSSWYSDYIFLFDNYYGTPSAHTVVNLTDFKYLSESTTTQSGYNGDGAYDKGKGFIDKGATNYYYPMNLPNEGKINYDKTSSKAGVFVESVTLDGKFGVGGRSVVTPTNISGDYDCVMFITARNRHQFGEYKYVATPSNLPEYMIGYDAASINSFKAPTRVRNIVLRGEPYASNGILLAPNKNMHRVELKNVAIYDVYKTISTFDWLQGTPHYTTSLKKWPNMNPNYDALNSSVSYAATALKPHIIIEDCNLRGYTIPGPVWDHIDCTNTTFEQGANTGHGVDEYTYVVETNTSFEKCYFKAPYIIDMTNMPSDKTVTFTNCHGTAANTTNIVINYSQDLKNQGCNRIMVKKNLQGKPYVEYYKGATLLKTDTLK